MIYNNYIFQIPKYVYRTTEILHPLLEICRLKLMDDLIKKIKNKSDIKLGINNKVTIRKIKQYFSQLLMNINTRKTFVEVDTEIIYLDDGLFNLPTDMEIEDFYRDVNYLIEKKIFKLDEFDIKESIADILVSVTKFATKIENISDIIYDFRNNKYTIKSDILRKYNFDGILYLLNDLVVDQEIIDKTKKKYSGSDTQYHTILLCCLLRYVSFGSGANQFVVDITYKKQLKKFGFNFECFASALNHYYDYYCSAFYDVEKYFGSLGSFMALKITQGMYMSNPPYDNNLLIKMYSKVKSALNSKSSVAFIMSIPKWKDFELEKEIDIDNLYISRQIKYEYFMNPITKEHVLIPPYISYLFYNTQFAKEKSDIIDKLKITFETFSNTTKPKLNSIEKLAYVKNYLTRQK